MECSSASSQTSISPASCGMTDYLTAIDVTPRSSFSHRKTASSMEIMNEISQLEREIEYLERYILSLYRSTFQKHLPTSAENQMTAVSPRVSVDPCEKEKSRCVNVTNDPTPVNRLSNTIFGRVNSVKCAVVSPSKLSEDIIRCIASMYCKLASQKQTKSGSSSSSSKMISSRLSCYSRTSWSPQYIDALDFEFSKPEERPYSSMFEVLELASDNETREDTMLQQLRFLVKNLEYIDPQTMKHKEKLAFWINIHNALVMHGYLRYGTQSYTRCNMVMQASYNVGGTLVTAHDIRDFILGISRSRSSLLWLQALVSLRKHRKVSTAKHPFAVLKPEPLAHFGLSTGMNSDPAVRVYRGGRVLEDLRRAREEFVRSKVELDERKEVVLVPKMVRYYARDARIPVKEVVNECLCGQSKKFMKQVWMEPNSSFRYLIHPNVVVYGEEEEV